jgi:hypothetical protein
MTEQLRGRALYDFDGDESQNELKFKAGEEIVVLRQVCSILRNACLTPVGYWRRLVGG